MGGIAKPPGSEDGAPRVAEGRDIRGKRNKETKVVGADCPDLVSAATI